MNRLFWKFFFAFLLALTVASSVVVLATSVRHAAELESMTAAPIKLGRVTSMIVSVAANIGEYGGRFALIQFLEDQQSASDRAIYALDQYDNELLGRTVSADMISYARSHQQIEDQPLPVREVTFSNGESVLIFIPRLESERSAPPFPRKKHPPSLLLMLTMGTLSGLIFSGILAWWFTQPIRLLRKAFQKVASGKLDTRVSPAMHKRHDELSELGQNFDQMTEKLQALLQAQQTLLHDVSHELRSPLARMQAAIGIAQQRPEKSGEILERLERESQRIDTLIGDLLNLSRLETLQQQSLPPQYFDLAELMQQIIDDARFEAAAKQVEVHYQGLDKQPYSGQPELLLRAIENVLRNAIKFSPENTRITVVFERLTTSNELRIRVEDQGPGVQDSALAAIFKPFYRGSSHQQNGSGLGLTIAKRAIEGHNGQITAQNSSTGGLRIDIYLPL